MQKSDAVKIIIPCAEAFRDSLENTNLLIAYKENDNIKTFNAVFLPRHFMHLTGIKRPEGSTMTSVQFYQKCLDHRLSENDFEFAADGTTQLKLSVLPQIIKRNLSANMIGDFREQSFKLYMEKVAGSISACIGFVRDSNTGFYVPNTVLKRDTRDVTQNKYSRILVTLQKSTEDTVYTDRVYAAKGIDADRVIDAALGENKTDA